MFFVEIDGEQFPMKYGHFALRKFMRKYKLTRMVQLGELPNSITIDDMPEFVKAGFDTAARVQKIEPPFTIEDVEHMLEEHLWLETAALEAFADSVQKPTQKAEAEQPETVAEEAEAGN